MPKAGTTSLQSVGSRRTRRGAWRRTRLLAKGREPFRNPVHGVCRSRPHRQGHDVVPAGTGFDRRSSSLSERIRPLHRRIGSRTGFISAEVLWSFPTRDVKKLADHLKDRGVRAQVLCWLRPPAEFMTTAVQQRLRSQLSIGDFGLDFQDKVLIRYRRLDAWIEHFGRDNFEVLPLAGNIVAQLRDLLGRLGIDFAPQPDSERILNPSIGLLAAKALLALNGAPPGAAKPSRRPCARCCRISKAASSGSPKACSSAWRRSSAKRRAILPTNSRFPAIGRLPTRPASDDALFFHWE